MALAEKVLQKRESACLLHFRNRAKSLIPQTPLPAGISLTSFLQTQIT